MSDTTQRGVFLLADLSGYTSFLSLAELDHARDVLTELLELVIGGLTPTMRLCEVEGDAVYVYTPERGLTRAETLLELIESTYASFRDRLEAVRRRTTCTCKACQMIPSLDLKFIAHFGDYILQSVAGASKPMGPTVTLLHRLAKNHVTEATGWRAYVLFTEACLERMGLQRDGLHAQSEQVPDLGKVKIFSQDLSARYREMVAGRRVVVTAEEADVVLAYELAAPPPVVWEWLNDPPKRTRWEGLQVEFAERNGARSGVGTVSHCSHGNNVVSVQTVVDWRPFEYYTLRHEKPGRLGRMATGTTWLEAVPGGTRVVDAFRIEMRPHWIAVPLFKRMALPEMRRSIARLTELVRGEASDPSRSSLGPAKPAQA